MSESSAWGTLRKHLKKEMPGIDIQRLEDKLAAGIPDTNICWRTMECWLEGKKVKDFPARDTTLVKVGLKLEQYRWLCARKDAGGCCYVWVRAPSGWWLFSEKEDFLRLLEGIPKKEFVHLPHYDKAGEMVRYIRSNLHG